MIRLVVGVRWCGRLFMGSRGRGFRTMRRSSAGVGDQGMFDVTVGGPGLVAVGEDAQGAPGVDVC